MTFGIIALIGLALLALAAMQQITDPTIPTPQDASLLLTDTVTKTADFNGDGLDLGEGFAPPTGQPMRAVIEVTAGVRNDGDETYLFNLQESSDNSTFTTIGSVSVTVASTTFTTGTYIAKGFVGKRYVRLQLDVGGTTPSITYKAHLNPIGI